MITQFLISFLFNYSCIPRITSKKLIGSLATKHYINSIFMCKLYCCINRNCNFYLSCIRIFYCIDNFRNHLFYLVLSKLVDP